MIVVDEILQGKGKAAVLCEAFDTRNQTGTVTEGAANIRQNDFGSLLFQLDIAALRQCYKALFHLVLHAVIAVREQCSKLFFKIVFLVCLTDEIQNGQAFFSFRETQTAAELL